MPQVSSLSCEYKICLGTDLIRHFSNFPPELAEINLSLDAIIVIRTVGYLNDKFY